LEKPGFPCARSFRVSFGASALQRVQIRIETAEIALPELPVVAEPIRNGFQGFRFEMAGPPLRFAECFEIAATLIS
jgi:hypothetical protein